MKNKLILLIVALAAVGTLGLSRGAQAATPSLSLSTTSDGDYVQLSVTSGDADSSVLFYYHKSAGGLQVRYLGKTNASGNYTNTISTSDYDIIANDLVYVVVNNKQSASVAWPYVSNNGGAVTLNKTGLVLTVGGSETLTVSNVGTNVLYLLNNSNPQIANVNISGSQITIKGNTYGQTVMTVCALGTTSNCASAYVTVQNSGAKTLTFSQSNLTIASGQSSEVTILNSSGNYTILNNSNPSIIQASINNAIITLTASNNSGSAALTVCQSDMSGCGIINASSGSTSSSSLTFNQTAPTLVTGQTLNVGISGGGSNYNISTNSNSTVLSASINGSTLVLIGNTSGSSTVTVCSSTGNCNSLTATVSYATSGPITLSQSSLWLQVGQAVSVTISGGTLPYSVLNDTNSSSIFSSNLNNNILTLTGLAAGSSSLSVCSAAGACTQLSVLVNGVSSSSQLTFSNNNLALNVGATANVSLFGTGGYYVSTSNNQNVATIAVSGSKATVSALSAGSANATICQTGGQCSVLYVVVSSTSAVTSTPTFSQTNPTISVGQSLSITISGGSTSTYTLSSNSNPTIVQANISGDKLILLGQNFGSSVLVVCAASNNCGSLSVTINAAGSSSNSNSSTGSSSNTGSTASSTKPSSSTTKPATTTAKPVYKFTKYLTVGSKGADVTALQTRLKYEGVYSGPITGTFGAQTYAAVQAYQKKNKLQTLGVVGPATRALLNK